MQHVALRSRKKIARGALELILKLCFLCRLEQAGAKHVYGIECSGIIHSARQIIKDNGLSDAITLIHGKVEDVELPVPKVRLRMHACMWQQKLHAHVDTCAHGLAQMYAQHMRCM
jgi:hypothetical protein